MRTLDVVPAEVVCDVSPGCGLTVIGLEVDAFVIRTAPHPLDKYVVTPGTSSIHGKLAIFVQHRIGEVARCELTALVGVDDLRKAESCKRFLDDLNGMACLQRDSNRVGQNLRLATSTTAVR